METMPIERLLGLVEARCEAAGVHVADELLGTTSAPRQHQSARVGRESTDNTDQLRNQEISRVEDVVVVELWFELPPKQQRLGRDAAHVTARAVRNAVTDLADTQQRRNGQTHLSTVDEPRGEWLTITQRYRFRRYEEVGRG